MNFLSLIESKRDGQALTSEQIRLFISEYTAGRIPDYQMASLMMAVFFRGMTDEETAALTLAMRDSGETLRFPKDPRPVVDKHSTGGVGDKISLPLVPLLAALGCRVPMISGRGLGITGGTLDKLESIPGFNTNLTMEQIVDQVQKVGCVICGQTERMVLADKALYALRDVTGTVASVPLIVASILSKKLTENLDALILDVKFGGAAFMQTKEKARELAEAMVGLGNACFVNTRALLTEMNCPLGRTAGNWLEVKEAVECLEGRGPSDIAELVIDCATHLLVQSGKSGGMRDAFHEAKKCFTSDAPLKKWNEMLVAQGADLDAFNRKLKQGDLAPCVKELKARDSKVVRFCDAKIIGEIVRDLGGGRLTKESVVNHDVGIDRIAKPGDRVEKGDVLARVHAVNEKDADAALARLEPAFRFSDQPSPMLLIHDVIR